MSEERQYDRVITTQLELHALVSEALVTGVLNLVDYKIDVDFNLAELLLARGQTKVPYENNRFIQNTVACSFKVIAVRATFEKDFFANSESTGVIFNKLVSFEDATFKGEVNFNRVTFSHDAIFTFTKFTGNANYEHTTFASEAIFFESSFSNRTFFKRSFFKHCAHFLGVKINNGGSLNFTDITIHEYLAIVPSEFNGEIIITGFILESDKHSVILNLGDLIKAYVVTSGCVTIQNVEADLGSTCLKIINLEADSKVKVHFENCGFYGKNVAFTDVDMQHVSIRGGNYVAGMAFYHCEWAKEPAFFGLKFRAFNGLNTTDIPKIVESYGNLKVSALEAGDAQLSNDFHFWHQWHQWENLYKKRLWNWNNFYRITSAYGMSVRLPLFWFICVIGIFIFFYAPITKVPQLTLMFAFRTSIENSLPLIGWTRSSLFNTHPTQYLLLSIAQHLIQGYLLFQIGAAIRNKVKR